MSYYLVLFCISILFGAAFIFTQKRLHRDENYVECEAEIIGWADETDFNQLSKEWQKRLSRIVKFVEPSKSLPVVRFKGQLNQVIESETVGPELLVKKDYAVGDVIPIRYHKTKKDFVMINAKKIDNAHK